MSFVLNIPKRNPASVSGLPTHDLRAKANDDKATVTHALEMLQEAESVVLIEYLEVIVPVVIALYVALASRLPSAIYNTKLSPFYRDPTALPPAVASILLYTGLQALTFVAVYVVMRVRHRLSALTLLAFVLETHGWSLQSKMVMWLSGTVALPFVHYGMDFSFKFDFTGSAGGYKA